MVIVSGVNSRMVFDNAKALIENAGISLQTAVLSQSYLRSEIAISTTKAQYHVPILDNDTQNGSPFNTEKRLKLQDAFVVSEIGIYLAKPTGATDAAFKFLSFPDPQLFTTTNAAAAAEVLYNGQLNVSYNNKVIVPAWDIARHRKVNQTQGGVGVTAQTVFPQSEIDLSTDSLYPCEPNLVHVGSKNIDINIVLPAAVTVLEPNSRIVIIWRGVLAQNSTSVY